LVEAERDGNPSHPQAEEIKQPTPEAPEKPHPEESHPPSEAPPLTEEQLDLARKQKWRAEGETAWETLQEQVKNGQPYTGEFKTKAEFLKRYDEGQTFNSNTRSWGKQAELRVDSNEPITYSNQSSAKEVLEALHGKTANGKDKSLVPYSKMLKDLGIDENNATALQLLESMGFGRTDGKHKQIKEDEARHLFKEQFEPQVLQQMLNPNVYNARKLTKQIQEAEPNLSDFQAKQKAKMQIREQGEAEVKQLMQKNPKLTREQAEQLRQEQASSRAALEITEGLNSSDKGNLMETWYGEVHGGAEDAQHVPLGEPDKSQPLNASGERGGILDDIKLKKPRVADRVKTKTVNGKQVAELIELKNIASAIDGENLLQLEDLLKIADRQPEVDLPSKPGGASKGGKTRIEGLKYTMMNPVGVAANAKFILEAVDDNKNLSFEVFNKKGEQMTIDRSNYQRWKAEDLIEWANTTN
jgi:hypothetical protein